MDARQRYQKVRRDEAKVLLAVVSRPFQGTLLHAVLAEAAVVSSIVPDQNLTALGTVAGEEDSASVQSVVDELPKASILHLACHGKQDKEDPLASGFIMKDKELTVAQLMELNLPSAFLAFLSACETAKGDTNQTDQAIHLAATTLYAGFKSVIGTMW